jgi:hypothetical protein
MMRVAKFRMANTLSKIPENDAAVVDLGYDDGKCDGKEEERCILSLSLSPSCTLSGLFRVSGGEV